MQQSVSFLDLDLQVASEEDRLPTSDQLYRWVCAALDVNRGETELVIRIVDEEESARLNETWRNKTGPTNVLSFPSELPEGVDVPLLGDLVICAPVVAREAVEQNKKLMNHWAHIVIHGVLHLRGFDHIDEQEAEQMEALETQVLADMGIANPYQPTETD